MQNKNNILRGFVLAGALLATLPLSAAAISIDGSSNITVNYNGFYDASQITIPGLSAEVTLSNFVFASTTVDNQLATQVQFNYVIRNTSTSPVDTSRVTNFAFDTTPNILTAGTNSVTGAFTAIRNNATQPNGVGSVEICFTSQGCPGGGSDGIAMGASGSGSATLTFAGALSSFNIDNSYVRYQSVSCDYGSACNASASGIPSGNPPGDSPVPEPSSYVLISSGLIGLYYIGRKRAA